MDFVYNFYENYPNLYPINLNKLKSPDREKFGYYWEIDSYMFLNPDRPNWSHQMKGFFLRSVDMNNFEILLGSAFMRTLINSRIKAFGTRSNLLLGEKFRVQIFSAEIDNLFDIFYSFTDIIKNKLLKKNVWLSSDAKWNPYIEKEVSYFWGDDTRVIRFPEIFSIMNMMDIWYSIIKEEKVKASKDIVWEIFSYNFPHLVEYIDIDIQKKIGVEFLKNITDFGII